MSIEEFVEFSKEMAEKAREQKKKEQKYEARKKFMKNYFYPFDVFDVRKKGDHVESYNTITGEALFEAQTESEAWNDLREEFGVT